ncbi:GIY-YIG nuclease family protein [Devosia neptuniae]|uniref:GIY-YIG nuclease family protein n=1 Tax=Devosia neptuniae TaxID=191302 RepID=A0ABY6CLP2_9HYPH|nr:GIY-YIG nuclease family protein [Devosia neptuniae]UXN70948.1 GIY-YIG nuclease family protein [Devosia neptuniae]
MKAANDNKRPVVGMACSQDDVPDFTQLVYVIRCCNCVKIGYSSCLWRREAEIRRLMLEPTTTLASFLGGPYLETLLHRHFIEYHIENEWFEISGPLKEWVDAGCPDDLPRILAERSSAA